MSDRHYQSDPPRRCGRKKEKGYYLESELGPDGRLALWSWVLGSSTAGRENVLLRIPPRAVVTGNPAATLHAGTLVDVGIAYDESLADTVRDHDLLYYRHLQSLTGGVALFDHVGSNNYTPWQFYREVITYGPSRRVTPQFAELVAKMAPVPVFFSSSAMPFFRDIKAASLAFELVEHILGPERVDWTAATWGHREWSLMTGGWSGRSHYIAAVLEVCDKAQEDPGSLTDDEHELLDLVASSDTAEQPFGASWITRVTYVAGSDEDIDRVSYQHALKGIKTISLEENDV